MINEETLTLYFYEDGLDETQRRQVEDALKHDRVLAARYQALQQELQALDEQVLSPAPEHLKHQWHDLIAREARLERQREPIARRTFPWPGMIAGFSAVLALGIAIGVFLRTQPDRPDLERVASSTLSSPVNPDSASSAFERGLERYLSERQLELASLTSRSNNEQSELLHEIVMQNRLFEHAAEKQQVPEIARLMRALEPILLQLAAQDTPPQDADALRRQLTFELNAMLTKLQQAPSKQPQTI